MPTPWDDVGRDAMERWREVMEDMGGQQGNSGTQRNFVQRYVQQHRGKPQEILRFAAQNVGPQRAEQEARRYVQAMENLLAGQPPLQRGGQRR